MRYLVLLLLPSLAWGQGKPVPPSTTQQQNVTVPSGNCSDVYYVYYGESKTFNFFNGRNYESNMNCVLTFRGSPGGRLLLQLLDVEVQPGVFDCEYDNIQIYSDRRGELTFINKFCGNIPRSAVLLTESNVAIVTFYSDGAHAGRGFSLNVQMDKVYQPSYPYPYPTPITPSPYPTTQAPYPTSSYPYPTPFPPSTPSNSYYDCSSYPWIINDNGASYEPSSGYGSGPYGPSSGYGSGQGPSSGYGSGQGPSSGYGSGQGPSSGYGNGQGPTYGPSSGYESGQGPSSGYGSGKGPTYGPSSGYESGQGPSYGYGYGSSEVLPYGYNYNLNNKQEAFKHNDFLSAYRQHNISQYKEPSYKPIYDYAYASNHLSPYGKAQGSPYRLSSGISVRGRSLDPAAYNRLKRAGINCAPHYNVYNSNFKPIEFQGSKQIPVTHNSTQSSLPVHYRSRYPYSNNYYNSPQKHNSPKFQPFTFYRNSLS